MQEGVSVAVVLIDPISFGASGDPRLLLGQLPRRGVPIYLLRKGEDLSQALQSTWQFPAAYPEAERTWSQS